MGCDSGCEHRDPIDFSHLQSACDGAPGKPEKKLAYGTAGFRDKAELLPSTCFRMGMLAVLRALQQESAVGIMVTASHNPVVDNGLKIADSSGGMLAESWEAHCTALANAEDKDVAKVIHEIAQQEGVASACIDPEVVLVYIGMDTRPSSQGLFDECRKGVLAMGGTVKDLGVVTTPQLHHVVYAWNRPEEQKWASVDGYYHKLAEGYQMIVGDKKTDGALSVDCANGVGALHLDKFNELLKEQNLSFSVFNNDTEQSAQLNEGCGAEFVQKKRLPPSGATGGATRHLASFDGDADRVVFFCYDKEFILLDGDKIAVLAADFLDELLSEAGESDVKLGIVQTAYANGAAHDYVTSKGIECPYAKTGVKYCHHAAEKFDIGIYFEANGHGTVLFKPEVVDRFKEAHIKADADSPKKKALGTLLGCAQLLNQAVGDSIADSMFVEAVLAFRVWNADTWNALYTDKPSRQTKVWVKDRTVVVPIADETRLDGEKSSVSQKMQEAIDAACKDVQGGRAFCRPSGTEDVVRVYAEANVEADADRLAHQVALIVHSQAAGVKDEPKLGEWH